MIRGAIDKHRYGSLDYVKTGCESHAGLNNLLYAVALILTTSHSQIPLSTSPPPPPTKRQRKPQKNGCLLFRGGRRNFCIQIRKPKINLHTCAGGRAGQAGERGSCFPSDFSIYIYIYLCRLAAAVWMRLLLFCPLFKALEMAQLLH